jgi:hypothetical protein
MNSIDIGDNVQLYSPLRCGYGLVVELIPAGVTPTQQSVDFYYAKKPGEYFPASTYKAMSYPRWIIRRCDTGTFIVFPQTTNNAHMVRRIPAMYIRRTLEIDHAAD